jgi:hypothetical protein
MQPVMAGRSRAFAMARVARARSGTNGTPDRCGHFRIFTNRTRRATSPDPGPFRLSRNRPATGAGRIVVKSPPRAVRLVPHPGSAVTARGAHLRHGNSDYIPPRQPLPATARQWRRECRPRAIGRCRPPFGPSRRTTPTTSTGRWRRWWGCARSFRAMRSAPRRSAPSGPATASSSARMALSSPSATSSPRPRPSGSP